MVFTSNPMRGIDGMTRGHYKVNLKSPEDILEELEDVGFLCFVHRDRRMRCRTRMSDWAFADIGVAGDTDRPNMAWKNVTPGFEALSDAPGYPLFDGPIRERSDDYTLYMV